MRLLLVDDDRGLRTLLRTTFEVFDIEVDEADSASVALERIASRRPDVVVLDVHMPGMSGLELCRKLKTDEDTAGIGVVLLTGSDADTLENAEAAGADAFLRKPFSPLELLSVTERLAGGLYGIPFRARKKSPDEQLILYARDLRHILEIERGQRTLVQQAYIETVSRCQRARVEGHGHPRTLTTSGALRDRACGRSRPRLDRGPEHRLRVPPARRRQDRDPRRHPAEAQASRMPSAA